MSLSNKEVSLYGWTGQSVIVICRCPHGLFAVSPAATAAAAVPTPRDRERGLGMRREKENLEICKWRDRMQEEADIM